MEHTTISKALDDLLFNHDITVAEAVDKHFAPDFRLRTNGRWVTREEFAAYKTTVRELVEQGAVAVHEELVSGRLYAEHHTIDVVKKDGGVVIMEVYAFGEFAEDGRLRRLEDAIILISGTNEDRELRACI